MNLSCIGSARGKNKIKRNLKLMEQFFKKKNSVATDDAAMQWLLQFKDVEVQEARWIGIHKYDFQTKHRPVYIRRMPMLYQECLALGTTDIVLESQ